MPILRQAFGHCMQFQSFTEPKNPAHIHEFVDSQYAALLTTWTPEHCESGAFNPLCVNGEYYLHLHAKDSQVDTIRATQRANLTFFEPFCTIPSYWVDAHYGGMATMYYCFAEYHCRAQLLETPEEVTQWSKDILTHYQPEGGHNPVTFEDSVYRKPIQTLAIVKLTPQAEKIKWKLGQNLPKAKRQHIAEQLKARGMPGDLKAALLIEEAW